MHISPEFDRKTRIYGRRSFAGFDHASNLLGYALEAQIFGEPTYVHSHRLTQRTKLCVVTHLGNRKLLVGRPHHRKGADL